ncbi:MULTISPECIES: type VII secretion target [unclassified Kitasatospora]|uniref:type VII secretion target n=1 Tax=unclassified Kitasatospora TaxID=2633591 RepID=UPI003401E4B3
MGSGTGTGKGTGTGTGTGSTGGAGQGYRVETEQLRTFAGQVRLLLADFQKHADGTATHGRSGVGKNTFGTFAEATEIHDRYSTMRDALRDVLNQLQEAVNEAQQKADLTATTYEEHDQHTAQKLKLGGDGWSVEQPSTTSQAAYEKNLTPSNRGNATI